jgi:YVTN family beta-propeller protein
VVRSIDKIGQRPWGLALSRDGARAYSANGPGGDISIIDLKSGAIEHVAVGGSPWGVVAGPAASAAGH